MYPLIILYWKAFIRNRHLYSKISTRYSSFSFTLSTSHFPTTLPISSPPTFAFISRNKNILLPSSKVFRHSPLSSQNFISIFPILIFALSFIGAYTYMHAYLTIHISPVFHIILESFQPWPSTSSQTLGDMKCTTILPSQEEIHIMGIQHQKDILFFNRNC